MTPTPNDHDTAIEARLNRELFYKRELVRLTRDGVIDRPLALRMLAAYRARGGVTL